MKVELSAREINHLRWLLNRDVQMCQTLREVDLPIEDGREDLNYKIVVRLDML